MSGPYPDPQDMRLLAPEWDVLFGFMIGRLLFAGYTPAQIQLKARVVADYVRAASKTAAGAAASDKIQEGLEDLRDMVEEDLGEQGGPE